MPEHLTVYVPAGIGDFSWIYSKLVGLSKKLRVMTVAGMSRASQMSGILPMIESIVSGRLAYPQLRALSVPANTPRAFFESHDPDDPIVLSANDHIMDQPGGIKAQNLSAWMPELGTNYHYDLNVPDDPTVSAILAGMGAKKYICIYGANDVGIAQWRGWGHGEWFRFISLVTKRLPGVGFAMIGASYDRPLADRVVSLCKANNIPVADFVAKTTLAQALDVIKRSVYMVAFPSGMPIMATVMRKPTFMFFPAGGMESMANTWVNPEMLADKSYMGSAFVSPEIVWTRMIDEYKLAAKMKVTWGENVKDNLVIQTMPPDPTTAAAVLTPAGSYTGRGPMAGSVHSKLKVRRDAVRARRASKGIRVK